MRFRFFAHAVGAVALTAGLLTAVLTGTASACSCLPYDNEAQRYARAAHVFTGVVLSRSLELGDPSHSFDDLYRYTVKVALEYKGDVPATVDVLSPYQVSACGVDMSVGVNHLVFAKGDSSDGRVESQRCDGTRPASYGPPNTTLTTTAPTTPCNTATS